MFSLWKLLKYLLCSIWHIINYIRIIIINLVVFFIIISISLILYNKYKNYHYYHNDTKKVLEIDFHKDFSDTLHHNKNLISNLFNKFIIHKDSNAILHIVKTIAKAKNDKKISGIILKTNDLTVNSIPTLRYLGTSLEDFKKSGKPVYVVSNSYTQEQYYIASFANQIILNPNGYVDLHGFSINNLYYKKLLQYLNIETHVFKIGEYKSAVEPFINHKMSIKNKIFFTKLMNNLWKNFIQQIAYNRHTTTQNIFLNDQDYITSLQNVHGNLALYALQHNLVDQLLTNTTFENKMIQKFGWDSTHTTYNHINISDYFYQKYIPNKTQNNIAVININDTLLYENINNILYQIHTVYLDPHLKGVILKINSPGGSLMASQLILDELKTLKKRHKPIVVIMDSMAASGAYLISTIADYIISDPMTFTGSIGIFSIVNNFHKTVNTIGIYNDGVSISERSNSVITQPLSDIQKQIIHLNLEDGYKQFIEIISHYRHKSLNSVQKLANGMVFLGIEAKQYGLVDSLGNFDDAVRKIAQLTHLKKINLQLEYDNNTSIDIFSFMMQLNSHFFLQNIFSFFIQNHLEKQMVSHKLLFNNNFMNMKNIYAVCTIQIY
ncbi:signal peptide peptidase SppA [Enterobacteriaceae endosymbiont of Macroplea appendiculata]|uniref:signal peptide peptidase SppA n=1 Tax=Enterobacteriaceae endosymbiont of Macroplea appendiculata TaxID=2675790 RepID=UPI00144A2501|nr:signal peptide peptidase SppA [Enterobacteriaceae endosymbiont of Macroplea appendiculata]QJC30716.1 signal peptide peptidase SppA [Enterobacteriaceae endosymbiont of Macroplea appendiculata]